VVAGNFAEGELAIQKDNEDQDASVGSPYEVNPFEPPRENEQTINEGWRNTLGRNYWVPMSAFVVVVFFLAFQAIWGALFPAVILFFALVHGMRYQMRLNHQANWGMLEPRLPDFGVFLLSCFIGVTVPVAAGIAFLSTCTMAMAVVSLDAKGPGGNQSGFVISLVLGVVAAAVIGVLVSRLFLPRKPKL
jgi:hypothetical protein